MTHAPQPPLLPHPLVGGAFASPVAPGSGWPGDPAVPATPVARRPAQVPRLARTSGDLVDLAARASVCRACPRLLAWREEVAVAKRRAFRDQPYWGRPSAGFGDVDAALLVVGLAPAAHGANRTGRLFTGDSSGRWLFAALHRAGFASQPTSEAAGDGLALERARVVPAVRCAPPANRPTPSERDACAPWLDREVELVTPSVRVVLCLGAFAWDAALGCLRRLGWALPAVRPRFGHGATAAVRRPDGTAVLLLGSYHVSQQNTATGRLTEAMLDDVLATARAVVDR